MAPPRTSRLLPFALLLGSCVAPEPEAIRLIGPAPVAQRSQPLVRAQVEYDRRWLTVGQLKSAARGTPGAGSCTATLIAPNVILTAAHCATVDPYCRTEGHEDCQAIPAGNGWSADFSMGVAPDVFPSREITWAPVTRFIVHPDFNRPSFVANDIALAVLARDLPFDGPEYTVWRWDTESPDLPLPPQELFFVGYGITGDDLMDSGTRRSVRMSTADFTDTVSGCHEYWNGQLESVPSIATSQFCFDSLANGRRNTCQGDSGGPAFSTRLVDTVVGVTSYGIGGCNFGVSFDTRVAHYASWIQSEVQAAALPASERCAGGVDEDGDGRTDCDDPDCRGSPACPTTLGRVERALCQQCNDARPCEQGLICMRTSSSAPTGICQRPCSGASACDFPSACGVHPTGAQTCTCTGSRVVNNGFACDVQNLCRPGSSCPASGPTAGRCTANCSADGSCTGATRCDSASGLCLPVASSTASSSGTGSGGGTTGSTTGPLTSGSSGTGTPYAVTHASGNPEPAPTGCSSTGVGLAPLALLSGLGALRRRRR